MPRKQRQLIDLGYYHLIARGNNRLFLFSIENGFEVFKNLLFESKKKFSWKLSHYCIMSNHVHLLGQIEKGKELPRLMQFLLFEYSRWYRAKTGYVGHLWQGRYKSPLIEKESYFLECGRYIEQNPLRAGIVQNVEDYPWSSFHYYAYGKPDELVDRDPYYNELGQDDQMREIYYRKFARLKGPYDGLMDDVLLEVHF
jgi:putative transposase